MLLLRNKQQPKLPHSILKKDEEPPTVTCFGLLQKRPEPTHHAGHVAFCTEATVREIPAHRDEEPDDHQDAQISLSQFEPLQEDYTVPLQESEIMREIPIYVALHIPPAARPLRLPKL